MTLPLSLYLAWRYIRSNLRQSAIVALAVGMGVSIIIFIPSVNLSFFNYFLDKTVQNSAHLRVTRELDTMPRNQRALKNTYPATSRILTQDQTLTRRRNLTAYPRLIAALQKLPGVVAAAPTISEEVIIVRGSQVRGVSLSGIVPDEETKIRKLADEVQEGDLFNMGSNDVFLGWRLADELGVEVGQRVQLVTSRGIKSYKVAGLMNSGIYRNDMGTVLLSLHSAQTLLDMPNEVTGIGLKLKDMYMAPQVADIIQSTYPLKARTWMEENAVILDQIRMFRVIIAFISFLIVMAAASSITSILIMVVANKSKEIGILKAMGVPPASIMQTFLFQAIFLSILGCIAGVLGGIGLITIYNATPYSHAETFLGIGRQPVGLNMEYTGYALFYALISSILASLFPSWRASKLNPVEAINS